MTSLNNKTAELLKSVTAATNATKAVAKELDKLKTDVTAAKARTKR